MPHKRNIPSLGPVTVTTYWDRVNVELEGNIGGYVGVDCQHYIFHQKEYVYLYGIEGIYSLCLLLGSTLNYWF